MKYTVFDTETTGLPTPEKKQSIIQLCMMNQDGSIITNKRYNPKAEMELQAIAVHHIRPNMLEDCDLWQSKDTDYVNKIASESVMIAHNIEFDENMCIQEGCDPFRWKICTKRNAQFLLTDLESHRQEFLYEYFEIEIGEDLNFHDARYDVLICGKLFRILFAKMHEYLFDKNHVAATDKEVFQAMISVTNNPILLQRVKFGKHRGKLFSEIDKSYLNWCLSNMENLDKDTKYTMQYYTKVS